MNFKIVEKDEAIIVGCEVSDLATIPKSMVSKVIPSSKYCVITARGKMPDSIRKVWEYVWKGDIERTYTGDFEFYDKRYDGSENSEVDIYVAVK
ncbi:MAG: GyrI-like domain-containing protein [Clostridium sp.]|jgi:predicted transcriptional regulator YdeE|uniref:GyrI-like domain-containing protein n=1 Tax=Clostridium sp. TaxID=1506 RepID=UPI0025C26D4D|nr:effector binding domain-containing protein [Clostridium sp.]MCH3965207.1 GyrI-like domain-containing protein [Clostridium sp.]MCI1714427.1 GyrI-like domain-containing protein [Clostridium sp.]MCI1798689.1 GyrI-like domain-containing protein [Clostridium sp.]MCI1812580.1 GyrI-like domain-containing protein [Clostridium sp.]MCI1869499.1 GyrI-like domain-containing protein [Clostridium sp.]